MYIYESHMGGFYTSVDYQMDTYCDSCGDSDSFISEANTQAEAKEFLDAYIFRECYTDEYIKEFIEENWSE